MKYSGNTILNLNVVGKVRSNGAPNISTPLMFVTQLTDNKQKRRIEKKNRKILHIPFRKMKILLILSLILILNYSLCYGQEVKNIMYNINPINF